jgi:hypothetical protein
MNDAPRPRAHLAKSAVGAGVIVLAFTVYWTLLPLTPARPLDGRYANNAVLALEFAQSVADVHAIIGESKDTHHDVRAALDRINRLDYAYLLAYAWLLIVGFVHHARRSANERLLLFIPLVVIAALADALENVVLLRLTASDDHAQVATLLAPLRAFTLVKWTALAVVACVQGYVLFREDDGSSKGMVWWRRACGLMGMLSLPLMVLTVVDAAAWSPVLTLAFVPVWLYAFTRAAFEVTSRPRLSSRR